MIYAVINLIDCLSCSPVSPITNVAPLSMVLLVSLIKEAFEDWVREHVSSSSFLIAEIFPFSLL